MSGPDRGKGHLSPEQMTELQEILESELTKLERSLGVSEEALRPVELDQTAVGRLSRIDNLQNQGMVRELHGREQSRLGAVVGALKRMEAGEYGLCARCGSPIPFGRLLVMPEAAECGGCG